jgi:transposase
MMMRARACEHAANVEEGCPKSPFGLLGILRSTTPGDFDPALYPAPLGVVVLAFLAALAPGDCESAGKRKNTRTRKGNPHVRRVLCQAAWAAAHTKHTYLAALFYRIASKGGRKKALIAVARHLIVITYHLIREPLAYRDLGANYFDALHAERTKRRLIRRLEDLGHEVTLNPKRPATP